jgi:hypothetical protein
MIKWIRCTDRNVTYHRSRDRKLSERPAFLIGDSGSVAVEQGFIAAEGLQRLSGGVFLIRIGRRATLPPSPTPTLVTGRRGRLLEGIRRLR